MLKTVKLSRILKKGLSKYNKTKMKILKFLMKKTEIYLASRKKKNWKITREFKIS